MSREFKKKPSMVKRILKWSGISFLVLLIGVIALPFIFKDKLIQLVKEEVNKNVNATVNFGEFDLSLLSTFPNFTFDIANVTVDGKDRFNGVRLAEIKNTAISLDLMSVISGDKITINKINLNEPTFNVIVDKEGFANYDIAIPDSVKVEQEDTSETKFDIGLKKLTITKANITYDDQPGAMYANVTNMDFDLTGDFTQDVFDVSTNTLIEALTYRMDGINYLNKSKIALDADVNIDQFVKYTLKDNNLKINELDLGFNGWVELLANSMKMDMSFNAKQTDFKNILSLVPAVYMTDFQGVQTKGKLALNGSMKGEMVGDEMPAFDINMAIDNGYFKYPDLPNSVDNINIKTAITHPQGDLDKMKINVSKFHMEMAKNPVDIKLSLSNPLTDPLVVSDIVANLDLQKLKTIIPMSEGEDYKGIIDADLHLGGRMSSLEKEQYQDFKAEGELVVTDITYKTPELPYDVIISKMDMLFNPQNVTLNAFNAKIGESDMAVTGTIDNILLYMFNDADLKGTFNVASQKLNVDELMKAIPEETAANAEEATKPAAVEETGVFEVPAKFDMMLNANVTEVLYDGLTIKDVKGKVGVKDQIATMNNVNMNVLGGNVMLNGSYNTQKVNPVVDFKYNVQSIAVEELVKYFASVETLAPIAKKCKGKISTSMEFSSALDQNMSPIYSTLSGFGGLMSNNLTISGVKVLDKLADVLKIKEISQQTLNNLNMSFSFVDGKVIVKPFTTKLSGMNTNISGFTGFDETIGYELLMDVPKAKLGGQANNVMSSLLGKVNSTGANFTIPDLIPVKVTIGGTVTNPKIVTNLKGQATDLVNNIKDKVMDTIKQTFNAQVDKILADAQAQADKIRAEAKIQADKIRAEGIKASEKAQAEALKVADQLKTEAYKAADEVENSAKNPVEKLAKKKLAQSMRAEADKKYQTAVNDAAKKTDIPKNQAEDKAKALEATADKQAQSILDAAQVKANQIKR